MEKKIIKTPRGAFTIIREFDTVYEAQQEGWYVCFDHEGGAIMDRIIEDNPDNPSIAKREYAFAKRWK